jgi:hypothetical protein
VTTIVTAEIAQRVEAANREALRRITAAQPALVDVMPVHQFDQRLSGRVVTHSGPPVTWQRMSGAQRGAVIAAALYEGWAADPSQAQHMAAGGEIELIPNHDRDGVGGMAGVLSPSMGMLVVEDRVSGKCTYSCYEYDSFFGAYDAAALDDLRQWNDTHLPTIGRAVRALGGLPLKPLMQQALTMGDELHCRQTAASSLLANRLTSAIARTSPGETGTIELLASNDLTFLPLSMAACKVALLAAEEVPLSTLVTVMCRNGTDFGIRISGLGRRWFVAPATVIATKFLPGFGPDDAGLDMGDSVITETAGLGAFAFAAAPAITDLVGGHLEDLAAISLEMREITAGRHPDFRIPQLGGEGTATGIDIHKVIRTGVAPFVDTATAHREPGHRIIGAGLSRPPIACFQQALEAWLERYVAPAGVGPGTGT